MKCSYCGDDSGDPRLGGSCILCSQDMKRTEEDLVFNDPTTPIEWDYDVEEEVDPISETIHGAISILARLKIDDIAKNWYDLVSILWDHVKYPSDP